MMPNTPYHIELCLSSFAHAESVTCERKAATWKRSCRIGRLKGLLNFAFAKQPTWLRLLDAFTCPEFTCSELVCPKVLEGVELVEGEL